MSSNTYRYIEKRDANGKVIEFLKVKVTHDLEKITELQNEYLTNKANEEKRKADEKSAFLKEEEKRKYLSTYSYVNFTSIALPLLLSGKFTDLNFVIELAKISDKEVVAKKIKEQLELPNYSLVKELFKRQFID